jgi:hypothetical protein
VDDEVEAIDVAAGIRHSVLEQLTGHGAYTLAGVVGEHVVQHREQLIEQLIELSFRDCLGIDDAGLEVRHASSLTLAHSSMPSL